MSLKKIALAGALALGVGACGNNGEGTGDNNLAEYCDAIADNIITPTTVGALNTAGRIQTACMNALGGGASQGSGEPALPVNQRLDDACVNQAAVMEGHLSARGDFGVTTRADLAQFMVKCSEALSNAPIPTDLVPTTDALDQDPNK